MSRSIEAIARRDTRRKAKRAGRLVDLQHSNTRNYYNREFDSLVKPKLKSKTNRQRLIHPIHWQSGMRRNSKQAVTVTPMK